MKKLSFNLLFLFLGLSVVLFTTSCEPDENGDTTGASVSLLEGEGLETISATVDAGADFKVQLNALPGEADLQSLTIYEDNVKLDLGRFTVNAGDITSNNPMLITGDDVTNGITWDIVVTAGDIAGISTYEFEVTDTKGVKESATIDITIDEDVTPLTLTYNGPLTITGPAGLQSLNFVATKGGADLSTIEVTRNGELADIADLTFIGESFTANPLDISTSNPSGFDGSIVVRSLDGPNAFVITVKDAAGNAESVTIDILGGNTVTTLTGVLLNSAGPSGTGGLDLDTGTGTGSSDATADIKDSGINGDSSNNWNQTIQPANGATLKSVTASQVSENFTFESVVTEAGVLAAYNAGSEIATSQQVQVGDLFVVFSNGKYFLLKTTEVNVTPTNGDNGDFYKFDIKF